MTDAGRGRQNEIHETIKVDLACGIAPARFPFDGAGARKFALEMAVEHRAARKHDGGKINGCSRHEQRRRGLVAACQQHDAVERIAIEDLDNAEIGEISMKCGRGPDPRFLQRMHRKFERDAARIADAVAHAAREFEVMAVAGDEIAAGLGDADDGPAPLQLFAGQPVIQEALKILRRHARIIGVVPPSLASEPHSIFRRHRNLSPARKQCGQSAFNRNRLKAKS